MSNAPTAAEHREWFSRLLPFACGGTRMLILRFPDGDPGNPQDYFQISDLGDDGVTVMPHFAKDDDAFRFMWAESAAMEVDIGRFWVGRISREQLDQMHLHAWVGLALADAAEQELIRLERAGEAPVQATEDLETNRNRLHDAFSHALGKVASHIIPIFPNYPQPFDTVAQPRDLLIVRGATSESLNFISKRLNGEVNVSWAVLALNEPDCRAFMRGELPPETLTAGHKAGPEMAAFLWELDRLTQS